MVDMRSPYFPLTAMVQSYGETNYLILKVWANLDNPIKSYDFSKFWLSSCMPPSQVALC